MNLVYILEIFFTFRPAPKVHVQKKLLLLPRVTGQIFEAQSLRTQVNQSGNTVFWSIFGKKKIFFAPYQSMKPLCPQNCNVVVGGKWRWRREKIIFIFIVSSLSSSMRHLVSPISPLRVTTTLPVPYFFFESYFLSHIFPYLFFSHFVSGCLLFFVNII